MSKGSDNCCHRIGDALIVLCLAIPFVAAGLVAAGPWVFPNDPFINRYYKDTIWGYGAAGDVGIAGLCLIIYSCCGSSRMRWVRAAAALLVLVGAGGAFAVSVLAYLQVPTIGAHEEARSPNGQPDMRDSIQEEALGAVRRCRPQSDAVIMFEPAVVHEAYTCDVLVFQFVVDAAVEAAASLNGHLPRGLGFDQHDDDHHGDSLWRRLRGSVHHDHSNSNELFGNYEHFEKDEHFGNYEHFEKDEHIKNFELFDKDEHFKNNEKQEHGRAPALLPTVEEFEQCLQGMAVSKRHTAVDDQELRLACLLAPATALSLKLRFQLFAGLVSAGGASLLVGLIFACFFGSASHREGRPSSAPVPPSDLPPAVKEDPVEKANPGVTAGRDTHSSNLGVAAGRAVQASAPKLSVVGVQPDSVAAPAPVRVEEVRYPEL